MHQPREVLALLYQRMTWLYLFIRHASRKALFYTFILSFPNTRIMIFHIMIIHWWHCILSIYFIAVDEKLKRTIKPTRNDNWHILFLFFALFFWYDNVPPTSTFFAYFLKFPMKSRIFMIPLKETFFLIVPQLMTRCSKYIQLLILILSSCL